MNTKTYRLPVSFIPGIEAALVTESSRRSFQIRIEPKGIVSVRVPLRTPETVVTKLLQEKAQWICVHLAKVKEKKASGEVLPPFTSEELKQIRLSARKDLSARLSYWSKTLGIDYTSMSIRFQKTRWGSCSGKGSISLNALLMLTPERIRDYVVIHELCHRKEMNHSKAFWEKVGRACPTYPEDRKWLKANGNAIIARLPE